MALINSLETQGNFLFKYRGQFPVLLFVLVVPFLYFISYDEVIWMYKDLLLLISTGISLVGFIVRAYAIGTTPAGTSGRNRDKQVANVLNKTGIYSIVRHPLYLGNYFMWIGIVCYTGNINFVLIVSLLYWVYYERIMFAEERFLERKFGNEYLEWSLKIPAFWPSFRKYCKTIVPFSFKTVLRREYSGIFATILGFLYVDIVRDFLHAIKLDYPFELNLNYAYAFLAGLVFTVTIRSLKKFTSILESEGRS